MLTFTHTYLINLAYKKLHNSNIPLDNCEIILGNVIPDFVTHIGRTKYQATAHNLTVFTSLPRRTPFELGAMFHILCDNYTTLGRITFEGIYSDFPKNGFIEKLSKNVIINIPLKLPKRRILQCGFDILVIRDQKELLIDLLKSAEYFLQDNLNNILKRVSLIYNINQQQLKVGLCRFSQIYGANFIEQAALEKYRLFPLIRSLLNLDSLTNPQIIYQEIDRHPELIELVELNMGIIKHNWHELLEQTVREVLKFQGMEEALS